MKGASHNNAHNNKQVKGNKNQSKKPLQVLSISKGDILTEKSDIETENLDISKELNNKRLQLIQEKKIEENKIPNLSTYMTQES